MFEIVSKSIVEFGPWRNGWKSKYWGIFANAISQRILVWAI